MKADLTRFATVEDGVMTCAPAQLAVGAGDRDVPDLGGSRALRPPDRGAQAEPGPTGTRAPPDGQPAGGRRRWPP